MFEYLFLFYLADVIGDLRFIAALIVGWCLFVMMFAFFFYFEEDEPRSCHRILDRFKILHILPVALLLMILLPSKQVIYVTMGGLAVKDVVESNIGQKSLRIIEAKIDEYYKEEMEKKNNK